jgi:hypothetical protein
MKPEAEQSYRLGMMNYASPERKWLWTKEVNNVRLQPETLGDTHVARD